MSEELLGKIYTKNIRAKLAVAEVLGTILILGIAALAFGVFYYTVVNTPNTNPSPIVDISGIMEDNQLILTHRGGESLNLDTEIVLKIGGNSTRFDIGDLLDSKSKEDGAWSLGEKLIYPIEYDFDYSIYPDVDINVIDKGSNSIVMTGVTKINPTCDLGVNLSVNNTSPKKNETVLFTLKVTNYWNINASGVLIDFLLPNAFTFNNCTSSQGIYNNTEGIWYIGNLEAGTSATIYVTAKLTNFSFVTQSTQFVILMDGSGSIASDSWKLACDGLYNAIGNDYVFPRDGSVELTLIQFGVYDTGDYNGLCARVEIAPVIVNEANINTIKNNIITLKSNQGGGRTPIASAFYLGYNRIVKSTNFGGFNTNNRQVLLLVTDGNANVKSNPPSNTTVLTKLCGTSTDTTTAKTSAKSARDYCISNLSLTADKDEIDVIAINPGEGSNPIDQQFLTYQMAWPQPCDTNWPAQYASWYRYVNSWQEFYDSIDIFFSIIFGNLPVRVSIESTAYLDPKIVNDEAITILNPT